MPPIIPVYMAVLHGPVLFGPPSLRSGSFLSRHDGGRCHHERGSFDADRLGSMRNLSGSGFVNSTHEQGKVASSTAQFYTFGTALVLPTTATTRLLESQQQHMHKLVGAQGEKRSRLRNPLLAPCTSIFLTSPEMAGFFAALNALQTLECAFRYWTISAVLVRSSY